MSEEQYRAALDAAAKQLSYRALSTKLLRDKLLDKGHSADAVDYAVAWLTERRLLDDAAYAESVVRSYTRRGYGAARIRQELTRRGVDRETAEAAMQSFSTRDLVSAVRAARQTPARRRVRPQGDRQGGRGIAAARVLVGRYPRRARSIRQSSA